MASEQKDWYNKDRVAIKSSVVLNQWLRTASPSALKQRQQLAVPFDKTNKR